MLIHQNSNATAMAEQFNRFAEPFAALKNLQPKSASYFSNMTIDMRIADTLIDRGGAVTAQEMWEQSSANLPGTDVA